jgi:hypothetical protein
MAVKEEDGAVAAASVLEESVLERTPDFTPPRNLVQASLRASDGRVANPGQAGWVDPTLPFSCRECRFWARSDGRVGRTIHRLYDGYTLAPRVCALASRLNPSIRTPLEHSTPACGKFELTNNAPAVLGPRDRRH